MNTARRPRSISQWLWARWSACGIALPVAYAFTLFWTLAEMPAVGFMVATPVLLLGALGFLPRLILRRRGHSAVPALMQPVLVVHWWCWIVLLFIHVTTSARIYSTLPFLEPLGVPFYEALASSVVGWSFVGVFVTLLLLIVLASVSRVTPGQPQPELRWATLIAAVGVPTLVATFGFVTQAGLHAQTDAAGDTVRTAIGRTHEERIALTQQRYEAAQQEAATVRKIIDPAANWTTGVPYIGQRENRDISGVESYQFDIAYTLDYPASAERVTDVIDYLVSQGWEIFEGRTGQGPDLLWADHPDGRHFRLVSMDQDTVTELQYRSAQFWTGNDRGELGLACPTAALSDFFDEGPRRALLEAEADAGDSTAAPDDENAEPRRFTATEWPAC